MTKAFWIWKNRLGEILKVISQMIHYDFNESLLDKVKYGLIDTSDERDKWFDYQLGPIELKFSIDQDDDDIIHIRLKGLDRKEMEQLDQLLADQ